MTRARRIARRSRRGGRARRRPIPGRHMPPLPSTARSARASQPRAADARPDRRCWCETHTAIRAASSQRPARAYPSTARSRAARPSLTAPREPQCQADSVERVRGLPLVERRGELGPRGIPLCCVQSEPPLRKMVGRRGSVHRPSISGGALDRPADARRRAAHAVSARSAGIEDAAAATGLRQLTGDPHAARGEARHAAAGTPDQEWPRSRPDGRSRSS